MGIQPLYKQKMLKKKLKNFLKLKNKTTNINMTKYFNNVKKAFSYYSHNMIHTNINYIKDKILNCLHQYTGYSIINLNFKSIKIFKNKGLYSQYNFYNIYNTFFNKQIFRNYKNSIYLLKYYSKNLNIKNVSKTGLIFLNKLKIPTFDDIFSDIRYINPIKRQLESFYTLLMINTQNIYNRLLLLKNLFYFLYKFQKGHFFRAFSLYSKIIFKIYNAKLLPIIGIKAIFKGRFGKVRKQVSKLQYGFIKLTKSTSNIIYFNNLIKTKRGSYGYHLWFTYKIK